MSSELHAKLIGFLGGEFARKEGRQCVKVELLYAQQGFRDEMLRAWVRTDEPEIFENLGLTEKLVSEIIEITEGHADSFGQGTHRFTLRTHQHLGGRATCSFKVAPSFSTGEDEPTTALTKSQGDLGIIAQHAGMLARNNTQMYQGTVGVLAATNRQLLEENNEIRTRLRSLERELDEARSDQLQREFDISVQMKKHARTDMGFQKLMQFGTIAMAKMAGGGDAEKGSSSALAGLSMMVFEFGKSLRPDQIQVLMTTLDFAQKAMFMEILNSVMPKDSAQDGPMPSPASNGVS